MAQPTDLVHGTLDLLLLKTISLEPKRGWAIVKRIQQVSQAASSEQQAWIKAELANWVRLSMAINIVIHEA